MVCSFFGRLSSDFLREPSIFLRESSKLLLRFSVFFHAIFLFFTPVFRFGKIVFHFLTAVVVSRHTRRVMEDMNATVGAGAGLSSEDWLEPGAVCAGMGNVVRWAILRELVGGEVLLVRDIAGRLGKGENSISKHLLYLLELGLVGAGRGFTRSRRGSWSPGKGGWWITGAACCGCGSPGG